MPAFRSVVSVLLRELGDFLYILKASPAGRQRHDAYRDPASPSGQVIPYAFGNPPVMPPPSEPARLTGTGDQAADPEGP
jgi:hypothetical protein